MSLRLRFGDFELDVAAYELRRDGRPVRLERQPMDLLIMLVERRGQLVTRGDIVDRLWGKDVFVDVETGVHTAIRKIRQALRDSPEQPSSSKPCPGRDTVHRAGRGGAQPPPAPCRRPQPATVPAGPPAAPVAAAGSSPNRPRPAGRSGRGWHSSPGRVAGRESPPSSVTTRRAAVREPQRRSGARLPGGRLTEETIASLGQVDPDRVSVVGRTSVMTYRADGEIPGGDRARAQRRLSASRVPSAPKAAGCASRPS